MMDFSGPCVERKPRILIASCGCIHAAKFELLCHEFSKWARIAVCVTQSSLCFIDSAQIPEGVKFYGPRSSDSETTKLLAWADIMVIAPLSVHTLAKIAKGICDDLLTSVVRKWDFNKPFYAAASVDPFTWKSPLTEEQCKKCIDELGIAVIEPVAYENVGAMVEPSEISYTVKISHEVIYI